MMNYEQVCPYTKSWCGDYPTGCGTCPANQTDLLNMGLQALAEVTTEPQQPPSRLPPLIFRLETYRESPDELRFSSTSLVDSEFTGQVAAALRAFITHCPQEIEASLGCAHCKYFHHTPTSHPTLANPGISFLGHTPREGGTITYMTPSLTLSCHGHAQSLENKYPAPCITEPITLTLA